MKFIELPGADENEQYFVDVEAVSHILLKRVIADSETTIVSKKWKRDSSDCTRR
jgi:hypothetical protein